MALHSRKKSRRNSMMRSKSFDTQEVRLHQLTAASRWWCGSRPRLGCVEMAIGFPGGPSYPGHSPAGELVVFFSPQITENLYC